MSNIGKVFGWACFITYLGIQLCNDVVEPTKPYGYNPVGETNKDRTFVEPHYVRKIKRIREPLPSEVSVEDQPMYDWIMDWEDYTGDWEEGVREYHDRIGDF